MNAGVQLDLLAPSKSSKLDLGCGKSKREGYFGVDEKAFDGVDLVHDLSTDWPWTNDSIEEVHCSHFVEHLTVPKRIHFVNELYRVLKVGGKANIIVPHWGSCRAYGDLTHQWPPVSEFWFYYLDKGWRTQNAPHNDFYNCDFVITWGYGMHMTLLNRPEEYQQFAMQNYKEAIQDIMSTWTKR